jgi:AraC-like DNA-binding protein
MLGACILTIVLVIDIVWVVHALFKSHNASVPQPNKAADESRDWLLERHVEEATKLREFERDSAEHDLRDLGFSDSEIQSVEFFSRLVATSRKFCGCRCSASLATSPGVFRMKTRQCSYPAKGKHSCSTSSS